MKNTITNIAKAAILGSSLFGFALVAGAWTGPGTSVAPAGNVAAPINVSSGYQEKTGILDVKGGFISEGGSQLVGRVDVGPYDCVYINPSTCIPTTGGGLPTSSLTKEFAAATNNTLGANILAALKPAVAFAVGTPSTDAMHVNGNVSITGAVKIAGQTVCLGNGSGCASGSSLFPITSNPTTTILAHQGAYIGWNGLTGGTGETDFINNQGGGTGGFAWQNTPTAGTPRTTLAVLTGAGNLGLGTTSPTDKLALNGANPDALISLQSGGSTMWHMGIQNTNGDQFQIGDGSTLTPRLTIQKGSGDVNVVGRLGVGTDLNVEGSTSTNVLNADIANINKLNLAGAIPLYRINNITGMTCNAVSNQNTTSSITSNPNTGLLAFGSYAMPPFAITDYRYCYMSGGFHENVLIGYTIPAGYQAINNALAINITGMTTGAPDYVHNRVPATVTFNVTGGGGFPANTESITITSGGVSYVIPLGGTSPIPAVQPGSSGSVTFNAHSSSFPYGPSDQRLMCAPTSGTTTGYGIVGRIANTAGATATSSTFSTGVGPC